MGKIRFMNTSHTTSSRSFWERNKQQNSSRFPNLEKFIDATPKHPWLRKNPIRKVQLVLQSIDRERGNYAVQNMRVQEWVASLIMQNQLNVNNPDPYRVYQTTINDDIWHHVDAYFRKRNASYRDYSQVYGIDFTFSLNTVDEKLARLKKEIPKLNFWSHTSIPIPTMVTYMDGKMVWDITQQLEYAVNRVASPRMSAIIFATWILAEQFLRCPTSKGAIQNFVPDKYPQLEELRAITTSINP